MGIRSLTVCIVILIIINTGFKWPQTEFRITSTFGESRTDHFHDGVDIISSSRSFYPVADGIVLYVWNRAFYPFENYTGSGNYAIIDHGEHASAYLHLEDSPVLKQRVSSNEPLCLYQNTGRSYGSHLHFGIYNRASWNSYNFLKLVDPLEDKIAPVIDHIGFSIDGSIIRVSDNSQIRLTAHHPVLFNMFDSIQNGDRHGIYKLIVYLNGKEIRNITFDELVYGKNGLTISGLMFQDIFEGKDYYKVNGIIYNNGVNKFKVVAADLAGNSTEKEFTLTIRLDF
ncbi:MAG: M23 family metallopeptidase [Spirochaetes bacterium]|nr:M23 family metallopeptidase [Spirochaetota bacterium]MBN2770470.1 M23 family metallopeptidase [Spirochaetota bacterium]